MAVIANGGSSSISAPKFTAYATSIAKPPGDRTPEEAKVVQEVQASYEQIAVNWDDIQRAVRAEVLERAAAMQALVAEACNQNARAGREKPLTQMLSVITRAYQDVLFDALMARERLDQSPY